MISLVKEVHVYKSEIPPFLPSQQLHLRVQLETMECGNMEEWIKKIEGRKGRANRQDIKCTIYPKYIA